MQEEIVFKVTLFLMIMVYGATRIPFMKKCKQQTSIKNKNFSYEKFNVFVVWLGTVFFPAIYIFSGLFDSFSMNFPIYLRFIGIFGLIADCVFFYYIHKELDKNWSPVLEIRENHSLITEGIYKYIRHPMYLQCWLWVIFQFLVVSNWLVGIFGIITWAFLYFTRVGREEKMMIEEFGNDYIEYMKKTGRLLPKLI